MAKYNLKDTCFLIYARIDSKDRLINLKLVIKHIITHFDTSIMLWEIDNKPRIPKEIRRLPSLDYTFIEDNDLIFHTTRYRNKMVSQCATLYFFICDSDVITSPKALLECTKQLRSTKKQMLVYPYDGKFFNVPRSVRKTYEKFNEYDFLKRKESKFKLWFQYSVGGVFGGRAHDFEEFGPDNENIYGWGPDDKERYYRLKKQGFFIKRSNSPLYHLHHDRNTNSWHASNEVRKKNELEYLKVFQNE